MKRARSSLRVTIVPVPGPLEHDCVRAQLQQRLDPHDLAALVCCRRLQTLHQPYLTSLRDRRLRASWLILSQWVDHRLPDERVEAALRPDARCLREKPPRPLWPLPWRVIQQTAVQVTACRAGLVPIRLEQPGGRPAAVYPVSHWDRHAQRLKPAAAGVYVALVREHSGLLAQHVWAVVELCSGHFYRALDPPRHVLMAAGENLEKRQALGRPYYDVRLHPRCPRTVPPVYLEPQPRCRLLADFSPDRDLEPCFASPLALAGLAWRPLPGNTAAS